VSTAAEPLSALVGLEATPWTYEVGSEKIREYASAVGETVPIHYERGAAVDAGFRDIVAPPMFVVVYCRWMAPVVEDERFGIDYDRMLHGGQEFEWGEPACAGDAVTTWARLDQAYAKKDLSFYVIGSRTVNQDGDEVARGKWTMIVRGGEG
jgi:acyl dehydratase